MESAKSLASVTAYVEEKEEAVPESALKLDNLGQTEQKCSPPPSLETPESL